MGLMRKLVAVSSVRDRRQWVCGTMSSIGKDLRLSRFLDSNRRGLIIPFDHGLPLAPMPGILNVRDILEKILEGNPDGVLLTPGQARACKELLLGKNSPSLLFRIDWTTMFKGIGSEGYATIGMVKDAVKYGADGIVTYLFDGYHDIRTQVNNVKSVAKIARQCEELGVPLIVEAMARGELVKGRELEPKVMSVPIRMAAEIGADIIKADYTGQESSFREVVASCPIPIMIAGGPKMTTESEVLQSVRDALNAGAAGAFFGRNVFQAPNPALMVKALRHLIHEDGTVNRALQILQQK